jgi:hypothetical protein
MVPDRAPPDDLTTSKAFMAMGRTTTKHSRVVAVATETM